MAKKVSNIHISKLAHRPMHPGRMLAEEMEFRGLNANMLALKIDVPRNRLTAIVKEQRSITPDTALRLERCLGIKAYLWLSLQTNFDLAAAEKEIGPAIRRRIKPEPVAHSEQVSGHL